MSLIVHLMVTTSTTTVKEIESITIRNVCGNDEVANYEVQAFMDGKVLNTWEVPGFKRSKGAWALVEEALKARPGGE